MGGDSSVSRIFALTLVDVLAHEPSRRGAAVHEARASWEGARVGDAAAGDLAAYADSYDRRRRVDLSNSHASRVPSLCGLAAYLPSAPCRR